MADPDPDVEALAALALRHIHHLTVDDLQGNLLFAAVQAQRGGWTTLVYPIDAVLPVAAIVPLPPQGPLAAVEELPRVRCTDVEDHPAQLIARLTAGPLVLCSRRRGAHAVLLDAATAAALDSGP